MLFLIGSELHPFLNSISRKLCSSLSSGPLEMRGIYIHTLFCGDVLSIMSQHRAVQKGRVQSREKIETSSSLITSAEQKGEQQMSYIKHENSP